MSDHRYNTFQIFTRRAFLATCALLWAVFCTPCTGVLASKPSPEDPTADLSCGHLAFSERGTLSLEEGLQERFGEVADLKAMVEQKFHVRVVDVTRGGTSFVFKAQRIAEDGSLDSGYVAIKVPQSKKYYHFGLMETQVRNEISDSKIDAFSKSMINVLASDQDTGAFMMPWVEQTLAAAINDPLRVFKNTYLFDLLDAWLLFVETLDVSTHARGIIHRDLKPDNIFMVPLRHDEIFFVASDYGTACRYPRCSPSDALPIVGTPGYVSDAQLKGEPASPADDVYSIRISMIENLLTVKLSRAHVSKSLPTYSVALKDFQTVRLKSSLENFLEAPIAIALHHPSQTLQELRSLMGLAIYALVDNDRPLLEKPNLAFVSSAKMQQFLKSYARDHLLPLAEWNPGLAGETIFSSALLSKHFPDDLGIDPQIAQRIVQATYYLYEKKRPALQMQYSVGKPNPFIDWVALLKHIKLP